MMDILSQRSVLIISQVSVNLFEHLFQTDAHPHARSICRHCHSVYFFHNPSTSILPSAGGPSAPSTSHNVTPTLQTTPPPTFTAWQPPSQPSLPTTTTNERRVQAYERHQPPMTTLAPFARRGVATNPFTSTSASVPPSRRVNVSRSARIIARQTQEYVIVLHPEPVSESSTSHA